MSKIANVDPTLNDEDYLFEVRLFAGPRFQLMIREEIAKTIEAESLLEEYQDGYPGAMKRVGMAIAAEIARGER